MPTLNRSLRPLRSTLTLRRHSLRTSIGRWCIALALALMSLLPLTSLQSFAAPAHLAPPSFPGPQFGMAGLAVLTPANFSYQCNTGVTSAPVSAAGITLAAGQAILYQGCGQAQIVLNAPASGHFQASVAVPDDAPAGSRAGLQLLVLGPGGFNIHRATVQAAKGTTRQADVDVSGGLALAITFVTTAPTIIYHMKLTGLARALRPVPLTGTGMPAGATPVPKAAVSFACVAGPANQQSIVSGVTVPLTGTYQVQSCGKIIVQLPPAGVGTLALRFGTDETLTSYSSIPAELALRVLDSSNHLLRKAIGLSAIGNGLQALWVDTRGGSTATLSEDAGGSEHLAVVSLSFLPGHYAPHANPDHQDFGSPGGGAVDIAPEALVNVCNAGVGTNDTAVAQQAIPRDSWISLIGCGVTELIMTNAHGRFHARFGISDANTSPDKQQTVQLITLDQNGHPLVQVSATAHQGAPAATLDASITGASILEVRNVSGGALGVLFDMTLTGHATLYDRVFPPSEPPVSTPGGTPLDPRAFTLTCNVAVTTQDILLIHQAALEQWTLGLNGCGTATLNLATLHGPHRLFSLLYGMAVQDQHEGIAHMRLSVLNATGKVLRTVLGTSRTGYGPRRLSLSLAGGAKLQITAVDGTLYAYALTAA